MKRGWRGPDVVNILEVLEVIKNIGICAEALISHFGIMKPARGPQTRFFSNYCSGIPGLANYEIPNEVCEGNFGGTFFRHRDSRSARNGCRGLGLGT